MENYTKYRLKSSEELSQALAGTDRIFVVSCNKCFKEFTVAEEPECGEFTALAETQGKTVTGAVRVDFLCNKAQTLRKLQDAVPAGTESVFVISCGLGIQTVAGMVQHPVFAAADTISRRGQHGMALTPKACDACAQCYLNVTGGICPVVDCSKSLLNGQALSARRSTPASAARFWRWSRGGTLCWVRACSLWSSRMTSWARWTNRFSPTAISRRCPRRKSSGL